MSRLTASGTAIATISAIAANDNASLTTVLACVACSRGGDIAIVATTSTSTASTASIAIAPIAATLA